MDRLARLPLHCELRPLVPVSLQRNTHKRVALSLPPLDWARRHYGQDTKVQQADTCKAPLAARWANREKFYKTLGDLYDFTKAHPEHAEELGLLARGLESSFIAEYKDKAWVTETELSDLRESWKYFATAGIDHRTKTAEANATSRQYLGAAAVFSGILAAGSLFSYGVRALRFFSRVTPED